MRTTSDHVNAFFQNPAILKTASKYTESVIDKYLFLSTGIQLFSIELRGRHLPNRFWAFDRDWFPRRLVLPRLPLRPESARDKSIIDAAWQLPYLFLN
jgi:hypothetical protein